jgi:hypothetical protein
MLNTEQKKKNRTLGLILASVVLVFFLGFIIRLTYFGAPKKPQMMPVGSSASVPVPASSDKP